MKSYELPSRQIPLEDDWDVVVVGGGPSGCTAATAAAREGARVLLVEAAGALGGMGTLGLVPAWCPFSDGKQVIYRGLAWTVFEQARAAVPHAGQKVDWVEIDPEALKRIYDDLVTSAGVEVRFGTMLSAVQAGGGKVDCAVLAGKAGLSAVRAKVFVDCTGDGDLAAWAGAEFEKGDELQPATHCFAIANVDTYAYWTGPGFYRDDPRSPIHRLVDDPKYPLIVDKHTCIAQTGAGTMGFNTGHVYDVDATDPRSVSAALITGRKMAKQYRDALAETLPAFANGHLSATGALLGVRETRRIVCDYRLTAADYDARRGFDDEIGRCSYFIDVHPPRRQAEKHAKMTVQQSQAEEAREFKHLAPGESFGIPYRSLTPRGLSNMLVAGRCISSDRPINGSVRVMPPCLVTGEAAGLAAALAAAGGVDVHLVETADLRARLRGYGAYLP